MAVVDRLEDLEGLRQLYQDEIQKRISALLRPPQATGERPGKGFWGGKKGADGQWRTNVPQVPFLGLRRQPGHRRIDTPRSFTAFITSGRSGEGAPPAFARVDVIFTSGSATTLFSVLST